MSSFNCRTGEWDIKWPGRVAKHDLIYLTPPMDPTQGIPLGNGDLGALLWCNESRLVIQLNKCDLWENAATDKFSVYGHGGGEEDSTAIRHAGKMVIEFGLPVFDPFYLADFKARLSLADATLHLQAQGPLGSVQVRAYISRETNALWLDVDRRLSEPVSAEVTLERFGSRAFARWYSIIPRDPSVGLQGTCAGADATGIYIEQTVNPGCFAVGCMVLPHQGGKPQGAHLHQRAGIMRFPPSIHTTFSIVAGCTSPLPDKPADVLKKRLADIAVQDEPALHRNHAEEWKTFWLRSLMECGDDYLDNLWHMTMYYLNACQRGSYPGRFIDGLWSWNRDVQPWQFYFHYNQQTLYWPLDAAGHHDLLNSYLEFRFRALPLARVSARALSGANGAFVSDIVDARGVNDPTLKDNHTPVAEIALDFWRHYLFICDHHFLRERALPYMIEAALYIESRFEKGDDGLYHAKEGVPLEGWVKFRDAAVELVAAQSLFAAVLTSLEETGQIHPHASLWREIMEHMVPLPVLEATPDIIARKGRRWTLRWGWFKGDTLASNQLLAAGYRVDRGEVVMSMVPDKQKRPPMPGVFGLVQLMENCYILDDPEGSPMKYVDVNPSGEYLCVYPSSLLGLKDTGSPLFESAVNTLKLHAPGHGGYDRMPIAMARLGLGREAWKVIKSMPGRWQFYVNGFGHYNWGMKADRALRFRLNYPLDAADGKTRVPFYSWPFRHMGMESMSVLACAINECLLQSHDGVIRVAPAVTENQNARFTLHAQRGFVVSSEIKNGVPLWMFVSSRLDGILRVQIPWQTCKVFRNGTSSGDTPKGIAELKTSAGERLLLVPDSAVAEQWHVETIDYPANQEAKTFSAAGGTNPGTAMLGLPRMF